MTDLTFLRVDASMNHKASTSRMLTDKLVEQLSTGRKVNVIQRDLAYGVPFIDEAWIDANFTDPDERTEQQKLALKESDVLVDEIRSADVLVMSVPIYNFGMPAAFKAWIDQIARARETFVYTDKGPIGLLTVKACYLIVSSGGTPVGSASDFVTPYIKLLFSFLGITDIKVISCTGLMVEGDVVADRALEEISGLTLDIA